MKSRSSIANVGNGRVLPASLWGYSRVHLRMNQATGLMSVAVTSQPRRHGFQGDGATRRQRGQALWGLFRHKPPESPCETSQGPGHSLGPSGGCLPPSLPLTFSTTRPLMRLRSVFSVTRPAMRSRIALRFSATPGSGSRVAMSAARRRRQGTTGGPDVQRGNVSVAHVLLVHGVPATPASAEMPPSMRRLESVLMG